MANRYHDEVGRFCSRDGMKKAMERSALSNNISKFFELKAKYEALEKANSSQTNIINDLIENTLREDQQQRLTEGAAGNTVDLDILAALDDTVQFNVLKDGSSDPLGSDLMASYKTLCSKYKVRPKWDIFATNFRSISSKMGNASEIALETYARKQISSGNGRIVEYYRGKEVENEIRLARKAVTEDPSCLKEESEQLIVKYHFSEEYATGILSSEDPISIPDTISLIKGEEENTFILRTAEAKLGGQLDAKNLPTNIEKLTASNHKIWSNSNFKVEKSIILLTTQDREQSATGNRGGVERFPHSLSWVNALRNRKAAEIQVHANENSLAWITGQPENSVSKADAIMFRKSLAHVFGSKLFDSLHPGKR